MRISRREKLRFAANGLPGWLALGFYLADRRSPDPPPVELATYLRAIGAAGINFAGGTKGDLSATISLGIAPLEPRVVPSQPVEVITV